MFRATTKRDHSEARFFKGFASFRVVVGLFLAKRDHSEARGFRGFRGFRALGALGF